MGCKEDPPLTVGVEEVMDYSLTDKVAAVEVQLQELEEAVVTVLIDVSIFQRTPCCFCNSCNTKVTSSKQLECSLHDINIPLVQQVHCTENFHFSF